MGCTLSVGGSATFGERAENDGGGGVPAHAMVSQVGMEPCYHTNANTHNQYTMVSREITGLAW